MQEQQRVFAYLRAIAGEMRVVATSHNLYTLREHCGSIIFAAGGRFIRQMSAREYGAISLSELFPDEAP